jgi:DNA-binding NarL/FixJ family response regulator
LRDGAMKKPRILLADDHALILGGLRALLEPEFEIVGQVADGKTLVDWACKLTPNAVVLDISMPLLNGFEAARQLRNLLPGTALVFLSQHLSPAYLKTALQIGVQGYVLKSATTEELRDALMAVLKGDRFISPAFGSDILDKLRSRSGGISNETSGLTVRQREILQLIVEGRANKEIADRLELSIKTVEFHRAKIMAKLGARSAAELTRLAMQQGILPG